MGFPELLAALQADTQAQANAQLAAARAEAERIRRETESRLAQLRRRHVAHEEQAARTSAAMQIATARREARRELLRAREQLLREIRAVAQARLPSLLREDAYRRQLPSRLRQALAFVEPGTRVRVRSHPAIRKEFAAMLKDGIAACIEEDSVVGSGFVLETEDERIEIDDTLEHRLEQSWPRLSIDLLHELGGSDALG